MLIDCDIHVTYRSIKDLVPYADAHTRELIERSGVAGLSMPTYPWVHPSGWIRRDTYDAAAVGAGTMFPGFTVEQLRAHVLDPFDVAFALANPDEAACFSVLPNARLAAGLASAYNDWLVDNWLRERAAPARRDGRARRSGPRPPRRRSAGMAPRALRRRLPPRRRSDPYGNPSTTRSGRRPPRSDCRSPCTSTTRASAPPGR